MHSTYTELHFSVPSALTIALVVQFSLLRDTVAFASGLLVFIHRRSHWCAARGQLILVDCTAVVVTRFDLLAMLQT